MEQSPVIVSPESASFMELMGPPMPTQEQRAATSPEVKSAVDSLLNLWNAGNSKGSHQGVIRSHSRLLPDDPIKNIPVDTSKASDEERLNYAMTILKTGEMAQGVFSKKGLKAWNSATSPLINAYKPAANTQWVSTDGAEVVDGRWEQIAPQLGFKGSIYTKELVDVPFRFDEYGYPIAGGGQELQQVYSPEFKKFVGDARAQGYDFVQHGDNPVNFNQRFGFRLPSGEVVGQTSIRGDQDLRDFGKQLFTMASVALPFVGGPLAATIGSSILPASAAASIGSAIGASASAVTAAVGQAALQSGLTALSGGDTQDVIRAGITGLVSQAVPSAIKDVIPSSLGALEPMVEKAISSAAMSEISGKGDPLDAALGSLTGSAIGSLSQGTELPPGVVRGAIELTKTGTLSPNSLVNAAIGLNQAAIEYQQQKDIEAAYSDPSRKLDVLQPPPTIRAEVPEDVYGAEGDVFGQDFYVPSEKEPITSLEDLIRYIDQEASSGPRPTPETLEPSEDTWMVQPEPSEPELFTPQTQQPRDEFVEPYMTTPAEEPTVTEAPEPLPEPDLFTPNLIDLKQEPAPALPTEVAAPEATEPPVSEMPVGPEEPTFDDLIRQLGLTPPAEVPTVGSVDEGYFVAPTPEGPTIEELLAGIGPGIQEGMAPGGLEGFGIPPTIDEILALTPPGIQEGMAPGGLQGEGIQPTPEELDAVKEITSQPSVPSLPGKVPTVPTAPKPPTTPQKAATGQQDIMGLMALMGMMGKKEDPQQERNIADISRGISMSPFGLPYGGRYG